MLSSAIRQTFLTVPPPERNAIHDMSKKHVFRLSSGIVDGMRCVGACCLGSVAGSAP